MQKNPTANERYLNSFALDNQQHAAKQQQSDVTTNFAVNTTSAATPHIATSAPLAASPVLASLVVTDSPRSPFSSQLSLTSHSQPSSPSSPAVRDDSVSSAVAPSDSSCVVSAVPVTVSGACGVTSAARVRVPLSQVVTSLTHRWSMEYLSEAEAGDVDAQCLVAQMYLTGWGALKEDQAEGKRWLQRAKEGGIAGTVNKLELLYLGDADSSGGGGGSRRVSDETCGYHSGYANTPLPSPSATSLPASFMPTPTHSFFASVAATISPKPVVPVPLIRSTSPYIPAGAVAAGSGRLSVPSNDRAVNAGVGSGSSGASSGDEHSLHLHSPHHTYHWHMHHARGHSGELGVSAS